MFDVAWAKLLADRAACAERVHFEMLQGMAPGVARAVRDATGGVLLYTPIVAAGDFDHALAYLFRRLEENSRGDNFLRHLFDLAADADAFAVERARFEVAVADRRRVVEPAPAAHRRAARVGPRFDNEPDADPTDRDARALRSSRPSPRRRPSSCPRRSPTVDEIDDLVATAAMDGDEWQGMTRGAPSKHLARASPTSLCGGVRN